MFKEFTHYTAWTDSMKDQHQYIGLIEYQLRRPGATTHILWVLDPSIIDEHEAEVAADKMLEQIREITAAGRIIYNDGVAL